MTGPDLLLANEDSWNTQMGAAISYDHVMFRNRKLHGDLAERSWFEVYLYGITGRTFSSQQLKILNAIWTFTSYPDPRIWNNRVAALAGTVRSNASLAVASALGVSDADIYGGKPMMQAMILFKQAQIWTLEGRPIDVFILRKLKRYRKFAGYGRPKDSRDERIKPMLDFLEKLGYCHGPFLKIAFEIEKYLLEQRWRLRLNFAGLVAGLCADIGLSPKEGYLLVIPVFLAGFLPCYNDAIEHFEGGFFPLRCSRIQYQGPSKRCWSSSK